MKYNTFIAKALTIGIALNSMSVLSYANTEIPNRYQTLEGEYITIDDSTEGNLDEIEIFGNTVQDEDNLENIQSVGDLYVDKNGNPILDSQGREQYKIDIYSNNDYTGMNNIEVRSSAKRLGYNEFEVIASNSWNSEVNFYIDNRNRIPIGTEIEVRFKLLESTIDSSDNNSSLTSWKLNDFRLDNFDYTLKGWQTIKYTTTVESSDDRIRVFVLGLSDKAINGKLRAKVEVEVKDETKKHSKNSILLPTQLQKVGDVTDRLYWDSVKGRYVVEKNVQKVLLSNVSNLGDVGGNRFHLYMNGIPKPKANTPYFIGDNSGLLTSLDTNGHSYYIYLSYSSEIANSLGLDNFDKVKLHVLSMSCYIYYGLVESKLIDTNITQKIKIPTYNEKTHVYIDSENYINPTLKVTVDRLPKIAKEAVAQAESDSNNHNISLARMYTNMLPESLYKDQLQEQLSEIFSSDVVLDKKSATANLDLYIKCENILQMSLSTNSITFEDFSGIEDMVEENAVQISINSSLPYSLNAYLPTEIQNADKSNTINKDILNIKENSESVYQTFANTTDKIILKDNNQAGNDLIHNIDVKLKGGIAHQKDVYKTTIKFEAEQK